MGDSNGTSTYEDGAAGIGSIRSSAVCPEEDQRGHRRPRVYDEAAPQALIVLWEASDRVCGKRLKTVFPILVSALERNGHLCLNGEIRSKLMTMSASTIDRLLRDIRTVAGHRRRCRTPTALRKSVPIRTFADWNDPAPGFMKIDGLRRSLPFRLADIDVDNGGEFLSDSARCILPTPGGPKKMTFSRRLTNPSSCRLSICSR